MEGHSHAQEEIHQRLSVRIINVLTKTYAWCPWNTTHKPDSSIRKRKGNLEKPSSSAALIKNTSTQKPAAQLVRMWGPSSLFILLGCS
jgi:hypothetical protein